jgi:hypothetical protein
MGPVVAGVLPPPIEPSAPVPLSAPVGRTLLAASPDASGAPEDAHAAKALSEIRLARGAAERNESIGESFRAVGTKAA